MNTGSPEGVIRAEETRRWKLTDRLKLIGLNVINTTCKGFSVDVVGVLPALFVKAFKSFTDLLLECLALLLGCQQSRHCFLIIRTLLRSKVQTPEVHIVHYIIQRGTYKLVYSFVFSELNTWVATVFTFW